ncbi:hypothetical protein FPOAC2_00136 [Fusarium poae]|jgi:hypothetical protein|uniref:hypothetical protein n=1 Tax=Fusarium poae TaxID=36050 RepID=UPI001CE71B95|nr:hypothetical protein FPOAC1_000117 [Fusarium poae]KAG8674154.1 hypothetical protein FPOAC1_000117 [Fusarium poae]
MATTTATELTPWEVKLRETAALYQSCAQEDNLDAYFEVHHSAFGVSLKGNTLASGDTAKPQEAQYSLLKAVDERGELKALGKQMIEEHQEVADHVKATSDAIKKEGTGKQRAMDLLEKGRKEAIDKSTAIINKQFDRARDIIATLPEDKQEAAADLWVNLTNRFLGFWKMVSDAIYGVLRAVIDWLENMWETVKQRWEDVKTTFRHAWEWFHSLFH